MPAFSSRAKRRKPRLRRSPGTQSLLILHLDADKLRADGLHLGNVARFSETVVAATLGSKVLIRDVTTRASFVELVGDLASGGRCFDVIVVVAHSNAARIKVARDHLATWEEFAAYLRPLRPRRLLLAACRAGRWDAGEPLFTANRHLRRILACPVNASKDFASMMLFAVPYMVAERRPRDKHVLWSQVAAVAVTGRQLREWRRTTDKGNVDSSVFDVLADIADPFARKIPDALGSVLKSLLGR